MALENDAILFIQAYGRAPRLMPYQSEFLRMIEDARKNPTPDFVHYEPVREKPVYVPKEQFYCRTIFRSPSDCDWIVPGTLKDTSDL